MGEPIPEFNDLPAFMTAEDLATLLSVRRRTIYDWVDRGLLPARRVGHRLLRFTPADLATLLQRSEDPVWPEKPPRGRLVP